MLPPGPTPPAAEKLFFDVTLDEQKQAVRAAALRSRDAMAADARARASAAIVERIAAHPAWSRASTIALFAAIGTEVDVTPLESGALANGKRVVWPRVVGSAIADTRADLLFFEAARADLVPTGRFRIPEPPADPASRVAPEAIDLFVVPGVAFDGARRRLGYGKGYYDRVLLQAPQAVKIAAAFDCQIVEQVPSAAGDVPVDAIATESRLL